MSKIKYPEIEVELVGHDGNAFAIIGRVRKAMQRAKVPDEEIEKFKEEATAGDYDHLLQTCMQWVDVR